MELKVQKSTLHTIHVKTKCYFYYSWELLILVKAKIPLCHLKPFVLSLFFMILLKNFMCDCTRVMHPKNPAPTHIRTHKSMKLHTSFAPRFPHAACDTRTHTHTRDLHYRVYGYEQWSWPDQTVLPDLAKSSWDLRLTFHKCGNYVQVYYLDQYDQCTFRC